MVRNVLDALHKSFTYITKRSVPNIDPWGTPNIILRLNVVIAPVFINGSLFERYYCPGIYIEKHRVWPIVF